MAIAVITIIVKPAFFMLYLVLRRKVKNVCDVS